MDLWLRTHRNTSAVLTLASCSGTLFTTFRDRERAPKFYLAVPTTPKALSARARSFYGGWGPDCCSCTHPDDESLWTGGTIARHIAAGGDADLIVCTWAPVRPARRGGGRGGFSACRARPIALGYADDRIPESAPGAPSVRPASIRRSGDGRAHPPAAPGRSGHLRPDRCVRPSGPSTPTASPTPPPAPAAVPNIYRRLGDPWQVKSIYEVTATA